MDGLHVGGLHDDDDQGTVSWIGNDCWFRLEGRVVRRRQRQNE